MDDYIDMNDGCVKNKSQDDVCPYEQIVMITAFYDIGRGDWDSDYKRTSQTYLNAARNYLNYNYNMIFFIDDRYYETFHQWFLDSPFPQNKQIVKINEEWLEKNSFVWRQLDRDIEIMTSETYRQFASPRIEQGYPENTNPRYNAITNTKIDFIAFAIHHKLVNHETDFICWTDFGYFNSILYNNPEFFPKNVLDLHKFDGHKLNFTVKARVTDQDADMVYTLQNAKEVFATSVFAGPPFLMLEFQKLCHCALKEMHDANVSDDDQHLYLRTYLLRPSIFQLYLDTVSKWPRSLTYFQKDN